MWVTIEHMSEQTHVVSKLEENLTICLLCGDCFDGLKEARQCLVIGSKERHVQAPVCVCEYICV